MEIYNSGLGAAIINSTYYLLEFFDEESTGFRGNHDKMVQHLTHVGLVRNTDYWLAKLTNGFALSPKDDYIIFEIKTIHLPKIKRLSMELFFQNQLVGRYSREIFLVPQSITETKIKAV